jgi:hypothetical protein
VPVPLPEVLSSPLSRASLLVALEGLGLLALGGVYAVAGLRADARSVAGAELGAVLIAGSGVLLLLVARGLLRRRRWSLAPALAVQLLALLTALSLMSTPLAGAATAVALLAAVVLYLLLSGPSRGELRPPTDG